MPELPELEVYAENLAALVVGRVVRAVDVRSVFTVRTVEPPLASCVGRAPTAVARRDKHLVVSFPHAHVIVHMKLSGRLRWKPPAEKLNAKIGCVKIDFDHGSLHMTEASSRKSASVHVVRDLADCAEVGRGVEPLGLAPGSYRLDLRARLLDEDVGRPRLELHGRGRRMEGGAGFAQTDFGLSAEFRLEEEQRDLTLSLHGGGALILEGLELRVQP